MPPKRKRKKRILKQKKRYAIELVAKIKKEHNNGKYNVTCALHHLSIEMRKLKGVATLEDFGASNLKLARWHGKNLVAQLQYKIKLIKKETCCSGKLSMIQQAEAYYHHVKKAKPISVIRLGINAAFFQHLIIETYSEEAIRFIIEAANKTDKKNDASREIEQADLHATRAINEGIAVKKAEWLMASLETLRERNLSNDFDRLFQEAELLAYSFTDNAQTLIEQLSKHAGIQFCADSEQVLSQLSKVNALTLAQIDMAHIFFALQHGHFESAMKRLEKLKEKEIPEVNEKLYCSKSDRSKLWMEAVWDAKTRWFKPNVVLENYHEALTKQLIEKLYHPFIAEVKLLGVPTLDMEAYFEELEKKEFDLLVGVAFKVAYAFFRPFLR